MSLAVGALLLLLLRFASSKRVWVILLAAMVMRIFDGRARGKQLGARQLLRHTLFPIIIYIPVNYIARIGKDG